MAQYNERDRKILTDVVISDSKTSHTVGFSIPCICHTLYECFLVNEEIRIRWLVRSLCSERANGDRM